MENIKNLLLVLEMRYGDSIPLLQILAHKYSIDNVEFESDEEVNNGDDDKCTESFIILSNNIQENKKFLDQFIGNTDKMIEKYNFYDGNDVDVKVFKEYLKQLKKIEEKKLGDGEKFANSLCKCIKKTILKLLHIKKYGSVILEYLQESGFYLESFSRGHKLTDDDLCQLDENLLQAYKVKTENAEKDYQVIEMVQPIISIHYLDEDDEKAALCHIPGICKYFVKEVGR